MDKLSRQIRDNQKVNGEQIRNAVVATNAVRESHIDLRKPKLYKKGKGGPKGKVA